MHGPSSPLFFITHLSEDSKSTSHSQTKRRPRILAFLEKNPTSNAKYEKAGPHAKKKGMQRTGSLLIPVMLGFPANRSRSVGSLSRLPNHDGSLPGPQKMTNPRYVGMGSADMYIDPTYGVVEASRRHFFQGVLLVTFCVTSLSSPYKFSLSTPRGSLAVSL